MGKNPICPICRKETKVTTRWTSDLTDASNTTYVCATPTCDVQITIKLPEKPDPVEEKQKEEAFRKMIDNDQTIRHMISNIGSNLTTISTFCQRFMDIEKKVATLEAEK